MKLKIRRYDPDTGASRYDTFEIDSRPGMSVLSALFVVQDEVDDSLSLRYSMISSASNLFSLEDSDISLKFTLMSSRVMLISELVLSTFSSVDIMFSIDE